MKIGSAIVYRFIKKVPFVQVSWLLAPAPPTPLTVKAVYKVSIKYNKASVVRYYTLYHCSTISGIYYAARQRRMSVP